MLLYYLFFILMGFILHFCIIFGTNLLTGGPVQIAVFCLFQCFVENEYQTESKWNETFGNVIFGKKPDPENLEWTSSNQRGGHEAGGRAYPLGAPSTLVGPSLLHRPTSSSYIYPCTPQTSRSTTKPYFHRCNLLYP